MPRRKLLVAVCAVGASAAALYASCSPFHGATDGDAPDGAASFEGGSAAGRGDSAVMADAGDPLDSGLPSAPCTALRGPKLVQVGDECIDSTEVTYAQYKQMLDDLDGGPGAAAFGCPKPSIPGQSPGGCMAPAVTGGVLDEPITCVTFCDAEIYCAWAGKHLCGPRDGGAPPLSSPVTPYTDEWTYACTSGGTGSGPDASTCALNPSQLRKVGLGCEGPPGVFDLIGNAEEWTATAHHDAGEYRTAGDSFMYTGSGASRTCLTDDADPSTWVYPDIGFRCCGY